MLELLFYPRAVPALSSLLILPNAQSEQKSAFTQPLGLELSKNAMLPRQELCT